ncbi:MAG: toxin-antitoxin system YwqK family antitoxin [Chlamydiales bacterium]|nr:toxin-antitoxin system YwqK family antitoxin [Chlamydiales bacterium]
MREEIYRIENSQLIICDPELELDLKLEFSLPMLPRDLTDNGALQAGHLLVLERDKDQTLRSAHLTCDGKRHGQCKIYYPNGDLEAEVFYQMDRLHGPSTFYAEDGTPLSRTFFCEGKREGKVYFYYLSGKVSSIQRFKGGVWEGFQEYFYEDGTCKSHLPYSLGKLHGQVKLFWEDGQIKRQTGYERGLRHKEDRIWDEKGVLIDEGNWDLGKPCGTHRHLFSNGAPKAEYIYHTPTRWDVREWEESGELILEGIWGADLSYTEKKKTETDARAVRRGYWDGNRLCWK